MIAQVCDRESRRDSWFENRLVRYSHGKNQNILEKKKTDHNLCYVYIYVENEMHV